jgi:hypothetical protein
MRAQVASNPLGYVKLLRLAHVRSDDSGTRSGTPFAPGLPDRGSRRRITRPRPPNCADPLDHLAPDVPVAQHRAVTFGSRDVYHLIALVHVSESA